MLGQGDGFYAALGLANQMDGTRTDGFDKRNGFGLVDAFQQTVYVHQRKVFTTPDHNEVDDVNVTEIVPSVRGLNKRRGCTAVSIGEKCQRSNSTCMAEELSKRGRPLRKTHVVRPANYDRAGNS